MKRKDNAQAREYFRAFYHKNHWRFVLGMVLMGIVGTLGMVGSWMLGETLDGMTSGDMRRLGQLAVMALVVVVGEFFIQSACYRVRTSFLRRALVQYKALAFRRISEKNISAFAKENTGRYLSVLTNDVTALEENYLNRSFLLLYYGVSFVASLGMMLWYSPLLAGATILLGMLPILTAALMGGELAKREKQVSDRNESFVARVKDTLTGFAVVKSFKAEGETQALFEESSGVLENAKARRRWWDLLISTLSGTLFGSLMQFGIFLLGAAMAIRGNITPGAVLIAVNLCNYILLPIQQVPQFWAGRKAAKGLVVKLAEITQENAGRAGEVVPPELTEAIALEKVTFGYEPEKPVLKDVSLRLEAGKKYALVGGSGSGKSTLLNLLMGGYDGYAGSITVDGKELREVDPDSLYDLISLIGQNVFLFDDTIRQNITMFREFSQEMVDNAVRRSGLTELVAQRGEEYRCGENGVNLSGGECQRVSIARCLLRGTPVLMLDEATASLDNQTAYAVTDAILDLDELTRLVVTHRLEGALLARYDEIFVLRNGEVYERGKFEELMEKKGYFYSLYHVANG